MYRIIFSPIVCFMVVWYFLFAAVLADDAETQIRTILMVQKEGAGHAAAVPVLKSLTQQPSTALVPLLRGMDRRESAGGELVAWCVRVDRGPKSQRRGASA